MRTPRIDTQLGIQTIDFCAEHNIPYMLYDWQWYMPCTSHDGDATKIVDKLDLHRVIEYGKQKVSVYGSTSTNTLCRNRWMSFSPC